MAAILRPIAMVSSGEEEIYLTGSFEMVITLHIYFLTALQVYTGGRCNITYSIPGPVIAIL
ncbi:hypothetical protein KAJ26_04500, partial [bacterium]|nr:hypothetical protein [bacterium]